MQGGDTFSIWVSFICINLCGMLSVRPAVLITQMSAFVVTSLGLSSVLELQLSSVREGHVPLSWGEGERKGRGGVRPIETPLIPLPDLSCYS